MSYTLIKKNFMKNQRGLTLIELMIAMVIGLLIVGTVITIFITNVRSNRDNVAMIKLNQELRGVMTFMSDELKRAGYSSDSTITDFIDDFGLSSNCIRYAYDENNNSTLDGDERFGFRGIDSDGDTVIDTIQWSNSNTSDPQDVSITDYCLTGRWEAITDKDILDITNVSVDEETIVVGATSIEQLTITITGQTILSGGTVASRTISEVIRIRNDDA
jgi:type IV pilus assembly protein PilW